MVICSIILVFTAINIKFYTFLSATSMKLKRMSYYILLITTKNLFVLLHSMKVVPYSTLLPGTRVLF